jgi:hypothetical protein
MSLENSKISDLKFGHVLRLIREAAILIIAGSIIIKILTGDFGLDFTKLSASELVSILLAFFSIALSAAFYFAATSQSNQFYDNVNNFTKDTSTLLGRLDEQVKGLDGRQSELKESIDKYYHNRSSDKAEIAQQATERKVQEAEGDLSEIVAELFEKAKLAPAEREQYEKRLKERDVELGQLRERLGRLASRNERPARNYTRNKINRMGLLKAIEYEPAELLFVIAKNAVSGYRKDLAALGYIKDESIDSVEDVTDKGAQMVTAELELLMERETSS